MMMRLMENVADLRAELARAMEVIAQQDEELAILRLLVGHRRDPREAAAPGLTRTQAVVLAILADGRPHAWWNIGDALEVLLESRSEDHDQLVRTIVSKLRRYFAARGMGGVIETHYRTGYRIAPEHLPYVRALLWPLDTAPPEAAQSPDP